MKGGAIGKIPLVEIYCFGSALNVAKPQDIDLLLLYDPDVVGVDEVLQFRRALQHTMPGLLGIPAHVNILSVSENAQSEFIRGEAAVKIWPE
jgi:hypothetical protein